MTRTLRMLPLAVLAAFSLFSGHGMTSAQGADAADKGKAERPNILFIMSDDHAYQALGCYGSKINTTPNLDRIAREGVRFDNCFVTNSICGPCRAVILTGKYSHLNGFIRNGNRFNAEQQTFPKLLQKAGYQTAIVGKWHLGSDPTGFDYWNVLLGQGPYYNPPMKTSAGVVKHQGYTTDIITDLTLDWLQNVRDAKRPFMLMYQHKAPHRNWQRGPKYVDKYAGVDIPEPETLFDDYSGRTSAASKQEMTVARHLNKSDLKIPPPEGLTGKDLVRWKYQTYIKDYLSCIDSVDENVGRVLDYLDKSGLADNTVVIYTSDQGFYLGDHGWYDKRWMYEESLRTPLVIRWPKHIKPGSVNKEIVLNLDFAETFLDLAGVKVPADMQGRSFAPMLEGKEIADWRQEMYYHYYEFPAVHMVARHYGVRTDRHKLIHFYQNNEWELFDLEKDPNELQSVYDDPAYADVVKDLKERIKSLQKQYQDDSAEEGTKKP